MSIQLKIKSKHLGLEAKVIKFEEAKLKKQLRWYAVRQQPEHKLMYQLNSITNHRKFEVRNENRATFLARAFIEGKPYKTAETSRHTANEGKFIFYVLPRVLSMVQKYHNRSLVMDDIKAWVDEK